MLLKCELPQQSPMSLHLPNSKTKAADSQQKLGSSKDSFPRHQCGADFVISLEVLFLTVVLMLHRDTIVL